jgi:hypothetical protein
MFPHHLTSDHVIHDNDEARSTSDQLKAQMAVSQTPALMIHYLPADLAILRGPFITFCHKVFWLG